jgi:hypothetical protein
MFSCIVIKLVAVASIIIIRCMEMCTLLSLDSEDGSSKYFRNVFKYLPLGMVSYPRRSTVCIITVLRAPGLTLNAVD